MKLRASVRGVGHALPVRVMTNGELETLVETSDAWIRQRTGIAERRICGEGETTSSLCNAAAFEALADAGIAAADVDLILVATVTPDYPSPATACLVQRAIGAPRAACFDISAACAGFIYALDVASSMIEAGRFKTALVLGADTLSRYLDWGDRNTCVLFGDAAAGVVLQADESGRGVLHTVLFSDGMGADLIRVEPESQAAASRIEMVGAEVYRFAVGAMGEACDRVLKEIGLESSDIDLFVPHQANLRIIESAAKRLKLDPEKVFLNVDRYGNTSGGSIPLALYEAVKSGRLVPGMRVMTVGFGAGLVWGANVIRW
ncbi:ketoacyl-ACP synthase III [bacterium]|nr:MAG: ketoacyl-ACP synthase III [bacterium]